MKKAIHISRILRVGFFLMAVLAVVSCQKQINPLDEDGNGPGGGGNTPAPTNESYMPHTKGSRWRYQDSAVSDLKYSIVATDEKKTISGITFYRYDVEEGINDGGEMYYGQQGNDYYLVLRADEVGLSADLNLLYLKANAAVGTTWTKDAGSVAGMSARIRGSIVAKGFTHTWVGFTYQDIVHSKVELEYNIMGSWMSVATYNYYCVKGIGLVKSHNGVSLMGQDVFANAVYLIDYEIK